MDAVETELMTLSAVTHRVIRAEDNSICTDEHGKLYVQHIETEEIYLVDFTPEVMKVFGLEVTNADQPELPLHPTPCQQQSTSDLNESGLLDSNANSQKGTNNKFHWNDNATLSLIALYKDNYDYFASTTGKKDVVWGKVVKNMRANGFMVNTTQCKDKFKYLKQCYMKKADNMKATKNSGAAAVHFNYFEKMDEIFGKKPNVNPQYLASSSRGNTIQEKEPISNSSEPLEKKQKRSHTKLREKENEREILQQQRHEERMALQREALQTFISSFTELKKILKKDDDNNE